MLYNFFLLQNGKWNGLMAELVEKKFDMVLTSLKVNAEREAAVDFTSPFLESGTAILEAKPTNSHHKFSLFRTYWLVWALLFQAPVNMDCPRAFTARFMASVWALFAVVFLAIYTASLASFMITREEWDQFIGIDDARLSNPQSLKPP